MITLTHALARLTVHFDSSQYYRLSSNSIPTTASEPPADRPQLAPPRPPLRALHVLRPNAPLESPPALFPQQNRRTQDFRLRRSNCIWIAVKRLQSLSRAVITLFRSRSPTRSLCAYPSSRHSYIYVYTGRNTMASSSAAAGLLARQLKQMQNDKSISGISCGLVDNNVFEWEVMLMIDDDTKFYGGTHSDTVLRSNSSSTDRIYRRFLPRAPHLPE
jgi:hypothetical protein